MDAHRRQCDTDGCLKDATHGVHWNASAKRGWAVDAEKRSAVDRGIEAQWCRWHAVVEAVLRNAGSPEATQGNDTIQHDKSDTGAHAQQGFPRVARRFFHEDD